MFQSWSRLIIGVFGALALVGPASAQVLVTTYIAGEVKQYNEGTGAFQSNLTSSVSGPAGLTRGPDGFIYASSQSFVGGADLIVKINPTTGITTTFANLGVGYGPAGLRFHPGNGDLYVSKFVGQSAPVGSGSVERFNATTGASVGTVVSGLTQPTGLAFDASNRLYISNFGEGNIKRFDGTTTSTLIANGVGGLLGPSGLAFGPSGNLFVTDQFGSAVRRYTADGAVVNATFASGVSLDGNFPADLLFDNSGKLWVANLGPDFATPTGTLVRFDAATGAFIDTPGMNLFGASQLTLIPVPEPATVLGIGGLVGAWYARRRFTRRPQ